MTTPLTPAAAVPVETRAARGSLLRRLMVHPLGAPALAFLALVAVVAVIGPWVAPNDPSATSLRHIFAPPGGEFLLGGDSAGRDIYSRLLVSTSFSVAGGLLVAVVASTIGVTAGLIAGYFGGWVDSLGSWFTALTMSLPSIIVLIAARSVVGPSMWITMAIFGAFISPVYYRVVYNSVRAVRGELYVDAARTSGLSTTRIIGRHILLAVRAPVILLTAGIIAAGIGMQAGFDFLGLGDPTVPTWGQMLNEGFYNINRSGLLVVWPSLALGLTLIALTLLGTAVRDELEGTGETRRLRAAWSPTAEPAPAPLPADAPPNGPLLEVEVLAVAYQ